jgi:hypothetical protein
MAGKHVTNYSSTGVLCKFMLVFSTHTLFVVIINVLKPNGKYMYQLL